MGKVVALPIIKESLVAHPEPFGGYMLGWLFIILIVAAAIGFCWWWFIYVAKELELM